MVQHFIGTLKEAKAEERTVLLSSHIMAEVAQLCDRVTVIRADKDLITERIVMLRSQVTVRIEALLPAPAPELHTLAGVVNVDFNGANLGLAIAPKHVTQVTAQFARHNPATPVVLAVCRSDCGGT